MTKHDFYMQRCFDLARLGAGSVSPNPMVGAVLVHEGRIIGEGWHRKYGQAHAEVNAVANVKEADRRFIPQSTLYVSLEPCCIHRNTPPCTDLILRERIPKVVVSCLDQTPEVSGAGIRVLREAGVEVETGLLAEAGAEICCIRNHFVSKKRPWMVLKFAVSKDGFMGQQGQQIWISNEFSKRYIHKLRSEFDAFLVGTNTALTDNPQLNNRLWFGKSPLRIVFDRTLRLPASLHLFDNSQRTWVVTEQTAVDREQLRYLQLPFDDQILPNLMQQLYENRISSLLVEGGARTLQSFLDTKLWDEAQVITGNKYLGQGIHAPKISGDIKCAFCLGDDVLTIFRNPALQR